MFLRVTQYKWHVSTKIRAKTYHQIRKYQKATQAKASIRPTHPKIKRKTNLQLPNSSLRTIYYWDENLRERMRLTATIKTIITVSKVTNKPTIIDSKVTNRTIRHTCSSESKGLYSSSVIEAKTTVLVDRIAVILAQCP